MVFSQDENVSERQSLCGFRTFSLVSLSSPGDAQIDAAQQCSQLLHRDLVTGFVLFAEGHCIGAFLQSLGPYREAIAIPI